jgi:hypothetical protein
MVAMKYILQSMEARVKENSWRLLPMKFQVRKLNWNTIYNSA